MAGFNTYLDAPSVKDRGLVASSKEVSYEEACTSSIFVRPIELFEKWRAMPGDIPHYTNIDPVKIGVKILPTLFILDVVEQDNDEPDFKWRLFGTMNRHRYGIEATGFYLSKALHLDASIAESLRLSRLVYEHTTPRFMATSFHDGEELVYWASSVIMPLSDDSGKIARIFGCTDWH